MIKTVVTVAIVFMTAFLAVPGMSAAEQAKMMAAGNNMIIMTPNDLQWKEGPTALPGSQMAILDGDPQKAGFFVMRLKLPAGTKIPPHVHGNVEKVTVISGSINLAMGDKTENPTSIPAGGYFSIPSKLLHNAWVDEETILQIGTMGPWTFKAMQKGIGKK